MSLLSHHQIQIRLSVKHTCLLKFSAISVQTQTILLYQFICHFKIKAIVFIIIAAKNILPVTK
ncbi:MAG: hypothetical protein IKJ59_14840, partial [Clostridia bacterium]|nr:hypothetical protein [Clostridia bacterium]